MKLTRNEEILLLTVWRLEDNAYGVTLKMTIEETIGKEWNYGTLYFTLDQLVKKDLLIKNEGQPVAERGGRRKLFYQLSKKGVAALQVLKAENEALWAGLRALN